MAHLLQLQLQLVFSSVEAATFFVGLFDALALLVVSLIVRKKAGDWDITILVGLAVLIAVEIWVK